MSTQISTMMGTSLWNAGALPAEFTVARTRSHIARRGKRETMAMRVALAVGGPRLARRRTVAQFCRDLAQPARRLAGLTAATAVIVAVEATLSVLSR